ncbi:formyltransferase family protein [Nitrococcus mobilis]|uniref:Methionyl-tRNA formyltransferase n=1 Tax=Nitrococcus mobilis Nb-231 TaxID=314278 RepID=A4BL73_9GAMM|nr:formyltransferase family protein [Nitrococcus mobilis]EAR23061.1 Methionyl-tRNA formyltransferase [Nitrococcus mobilis Nb-231]
MKIALFNIESFSSAKAIQSILERHKDEIKIVITTDPIRGSWRFFLTQTFKHLRRSGLSFTAYLFYNFILHRHLAKCSTWMAKRLGRKPHYQSIQNLCEDLGIHYLRVIDINNPEIKQKLNALAIDLIAIYYFDQILQEPLIRLPKHGVVNFHPAPLPFCRGLHPILYCALNNNCRFAVTAHEITDCRIDAGAILGQTPIVTTKKHDIFSLDEQINLLGCKLFTSIIENLEAAKSTKRLQEGGSYFSNPSREDIVSLYRQGYSMANLIRFIRRYFSFSAAPISHLSAGACTPLSTKTSITRSKKARKHGSKGKAHVVARSVAERRVGHQ